MRIGIPRDGASGVVEASRTHAAIVLAAGGSRRLGTPKQLLIRDGETLVHRAVRHASATQPRRLVVVVGGDRYEVLRALADLDGERVFNPQWQDGLASSLRHAAQALAGHDGPVLILGCDQPALEALHLRQLLEGAAGAASGCAATVHGTTLGSPAVITAAMLQEANRLNGDRGFGSRLAGLSDNSVWHFAAPELQLDIDDAEDQRAAIALGLLDRPDA